MPGLLLPPSLPTPPRPSNRILAARGRSILANNEFSSAINALSLGNSHPATITLVRAVCTKALNAKARLFGLATIGRECQRNVARQVSVEANSIDLSCVRGLILATCDELKVQVERLAAKMRAVMDDVSSRFAGDVALAHELVSLYQAHMEVHLRVEVIGFCWRMDDEEA